ncbi:kinase-like protein [Eremomyces bilateralis CBS 781.70]|uniref:Kinase-like protein n=1 Tax=Eremomyces bilateralis CBS 781.70 TaxID=1392243 RepID=A0A6G1G850_9PEZI|nr:kinase-like protein [Eremomyces bilateralis CBS 781.70]KAF1814101.1 kinase-like protein [Eremomyces bilateralis CBS 781.70]
MPRTPDLVSDSKLITEFSNSATIHAVHDIDEAGSRSYRKEYWKWDRNFGYGRFGAVLLQICVTTGAKQDALRAVKVINKSPNFNRELEAIAKFSHKRYEHWFVKSFGWYEDLSSIFITMEYCHYGDLHHYLFNQRSLLAVEAQQVTRQILEGLDHMHKNEFAHRDLKPGNILIKLKPPEGKWWVVLADFGISKRDEESNAPTTTIQGTKGYMAPELLGFPDLTKPKHISDFKAADMWALGEIAFRMLTGNATFKSEWELMEYYQQKRPFPSDQLPSSARGDGEEFICNLIGMRPNMRMTTTQCLEHRWIESQRITLEELG